MWICALLSVFLFTSSLWATPTNCYDCENLVTWTAVYDPADVYLQKCGGPYSVNIPLDIIGAGYQPGVDTLYKYRIDVYLYDDADKSGGAGYIETVGLSNKLTLFTLGTNPVALKSDAQFLPLLKDDGHLDLILKIMCGDFYFDRAVISALGCENGPAPVPEPATMLLLGSGLVGLAGYGRKRFKKA
jgi:hypothetical protein